MPPSAIADRCCHNSTAYSLPKLRTPEPARLADNLLRYLPDSVGHPGRQWRLTWTLVKALWLLDYPRVHDDADAMDDGAKVQRRLGAPLAVSCCKRVLGVIAYTISNIAPPQQELAARAQSWRQRVELSKWLRDAAKEAVGRERAQLTAHSVAEIFSCLSGGQIRDACQACHDLSSLRNWDGLWYLFKQYLIVLKDRSCQVGGQNHH